MLGSGSAVVKQTGRFESGEQILQDVPVHVCQSAIDAILSDGQSGVIDSKQVQDGGVDIVDLSGVIAIEGFVAPFVGVSAGDATADSTATQPVGEDIRVMVTAGGPLSGGHASEFCCPEDDGVIQQSALFEIFDERGGADGHTHGQWSVVALNIFVAVPVTAWEAVIVSAPDLNKSDASFQQSASDEAFATEAVSFFWDIDFRGPGTAGFCQPVGFESGGGFLGQVEGFGGTELHASGEFVGAEPGFESGIAGVALVVALVE